MTIESMEENAFSSESAGSLSEREQALRTDKALHDKLDLLAKRLEALAFFQDLSLQEFGENLPGYKRIMPMIATSVVDICHALIRRFTSYFPKSTYDVIDLCEQHGLVPTYLIKPLAVQLVLIDDGVDRIGPSEAHEIHKNIHRTTRTFRHFLDHSRDFLEKSKTE